jgi:alginate O-acetyltransferase complex protein AlgJ
MKKTTRTTVLALVLIVCGGAAPRGEPVPLAELVGGAQGSVITGREGWLFFVPELRHLAAGRYWGETAAGDPVPAILDFKTQLASVGIELLFVPVPAKAAIYPQFLTGVEPADRDFLAHLRAQGVDVLDLAVPFLAQAEKGAPLYCRQDSHWSPRGIEVAARAIAEKIAGRPWLAAIPKLELRTRVETIEIEGDLWRELPEPRPPKERLELTVVGQQTAAGFAPLAPDRASPVLLLGDSHTLVFHAGADLHSTGAGLADQLARELGFALDVVGVRGSGATPARINLMRRPGGLEGKRLVVWVLSVREGTQGQGWKKVPVVRN